MLQIRKKKNKLAVHGLLVICACIISCLLLFSNRSMRGKVQTVSYDDLFMPEDTVSVLNDVIMYTVNSRLEGLTVFNEEEDPELLMAFREGPQNVRSVGLLLEEGFQHEAACTMYYPLEDGSYTEARQDVFTLPKGKRLIYFEIPEDVNNKMPELRVDIDEDYYIIEDILISEQPVRAYYQPLQQKWPAAVYFVIWLIILELGFYFLPALSIRAARLWEKRQRIAQMAALLAGGAVAGNAAAFVLFRLTGRAYSAFWIALVGLCSMLITCQIYLLYKAEAKQGGKPGSGGMTGAIYGGKPGSGGMTGAVYGGKPGRAAGAVYGGKSDCTTGVARKGEAECGTGNVRMPQGSAKQPAPARWLTALRDTMRMQPAHWALGCCVLVFCLMIVFEWADGAEAVPELAGIIRFSFPFAFALIETVLLALLFRSYLLNAKENKISFFRVYLFLFFVMGLGYMLVFLPFISPDEPSHYVSAYRMSNLMMGNFSQWGEERLLMRMEDYPLFDQRSLILDAEYYMQNTENFEIFAGTSGYIAIDAPMVTNAIFSYLIPGLGITLARLLHLSAGMTFLAGRFANFLFFWAVLRYLMKKIPFGRTALFAIAMMPMTLHTAASYSYDVSTFCFVALFVTQVMCMICDRERVSQKDYRNCLIYAALLGPSKVVYVPLLFLILLVPWDNLGETKKDAWKKRGLVILIGMAAAVIVTLAVSLGNAHSTLRQLTNEETAVQMLTWIDEPGYSLSWILGHIGEYLMMNIRTLIQMADYYFFSMVGSMLGWLDVNIPNVYAIISFALFFLAVNIRDDASADIRISIGKKLWILILSMGTVCAVILIMAVSWTPVSYDFVTGVQGRYFLPLLLAVIWVFRNDLIRVRSVIRKHIVLAEGMLNVWILVYVFAQYIMRQ